MTFDQPATELMRRRYSCRSYRETPIAAELRRPLANFAASLTVGPFGTRSRLELIAATEGDRRALKGLGTYGFIKGATGFLVGATTGAGNSLEDFGYLMECLVLRATDLGLGTCWLGGSFTKSRFAEAIGAGQGETVPAVVATGYEAEQPRALDQVIRRGAGAHRRLPWAELFFVESFDHPLSPEAAGDWNTPLEMVRIGPSASNKQPWRIVRAGDLWHFYLQRTSGYRRGILGRLMDIADMQRLDMGIALSHFELAARECGLPGGWQVRDPGLAVPDDLTSYLVTWSAEAP